ncbi:MAG: AAA family ATPase, partial [Lentisphaeria bacterium]|nr:AAA family ATPase [Lentisphaeria bacterium]
MRFTSNFRRRSKPQGDFKTPIPESGTLCGEVSHIVYSSEDEAYSVVRILDGNGKEYMAVGSMPGVTEVQTVELEGKWEINPEHGLQLRVTVCNFSLPVTPEGIMRYLSSGIIPGVGPKTAKQIVDRFGTDTLRVLDEEPRKLLWIKGFSQKKINAIRTAWQEHDDKRDLRIFLEGLGITPAYFARIYKLYGDNAAQKIRENPYCLASDVRGIGFLLADKIARNAGIGLDDPKRLVAGVSYALDQIRQSGHVCIPRGDFLPKIAEMLEISPEDADRAIVNAVIAGRVVSDFAPDNTEMLYSPLFLRCENELPYLVKKLLIQPYHAGGKLAQVALELYSKFSDEQLKAVDAVSLSPLSIITGGPGVGKTTVVSEIVRRAKAVRVPIILAAPTGRAAKRLSEATGEEASTIHRLLKWDPVNTSFVHDKDNPVPGQLFVIDEAS